MPKAFAAMIGMLLVAHGIVGLPVEGHLALFNVDIAMDLLHIATGLLLLFVSRDAAAGRTVRLALVVVAAVFVLLGTAGLADPELAGFAPAGLIVGDFFLLFGLGAAGLLGAVLPRAARPIWADQAEGIQTMVRLPAVGRGER